MAREVNRALGPKGSRLPLFTELPRRSILGNSVAWKEPELLDPGPLLYYRLLVIPIRAVDYRIPCFTNTLIFATISS